MTKKTIIILIIFGILLPGFSFAQQPISPPESLERAKEKGERALETIPRKLPGILEGIWKEEVLPIWREIYNWLKKNLWDPYVLPFFQKMWKKDVEKRKEIIEEEFQKEKRELKKEIKEEIIPKTFDSLWEKFKELIK